MDEFGHHEVTHMITVIRDMWEDWIVSHPAVCENELILTKANNVQDFLGHFNSDWLNHVVEKFPMDKK